MTDVALLGFKVDSKTVVDAADDLDRLGDEAERTEKRTGQSTSKINKDFDGMARAAKIAAGVVGSAIGAISIGAVASQSIAMRREFGSAIAEVSTLLGNEADQIALVEEGARSLARTYGGTATEQTRAYYQAISAGAADAAAATELLDTANMLAVGGVTDVTTGVDILTTAMNAYAATGVTAADASDVLFTGMRAGKTTVGELSGALGNVIPIAASAGIEFSELVAATSALTTQGQSTSVAVTGLRQVIASVIKPTQQASDEAERLGIAFSSDRLADVGLNQFLNEVIEAADGSQESLAQLFGSVEALNAVLSFAGGGGLKFNDIMRQMEQRAGATATAFSKMADDDAFRLDAALSKIQDRMIDAGGVMLTVMTPAVEMVADSFDAVIVGGAVMAATTLPGIVGGMVGLTSSAALATAGMGALRAAMLAMPHLALAAGAAMAFQAFADGRRLASELSGALDDAAESQDDLTDATTRFYEDTSRSNAQAMVQAAETARAQIEATLAIANREYHQKLLNLGRFGTLLSGVSAQDLKDGEQNLQDLEAALFDAETRLSAAAHALENFGDAAADTGNSTGDAAGGVRDLSEAMKLLETAGKGLSGGVSFGSGDLEMSSRALREMAREIDTVTAAQERMASANADRSIRGVAEAAVDLQYEIGLAGSAIAEYVALAETAATAGNFRDSAAALADMVAYLDETTGGAASTDAEARALYASLVDALGTAVEFAGLDMAGGVNAAASSAAQLAASLGVSLEAASRLMALGGGAADEVIFDPRDPRYDPTRASMARMLENAGTVSPFAASRNKPATGSASGSGGAGGASDAQREAEKMARAAEQWVTKTRTAVEQLNVELADLAELNEMGFFAENPEAYSRAVDMVNESFREAEFGDVRRELDGISDSIANAIVNGEDLGETFGNILKGIAADIISSNIKGLLYDAFNVGSPQQGGGIGSAIGKWIGGLFGGARAEGGPVSAGKSYLVGERGPEIVTMGGSGFVTPNHAIGGGGGTLTVVVDVRSSEDLIATAQQAGAQAGAEAGPGAVALQITSGRGAAHSALKQAGYVRKQGAF